MPWRTVRLMFSISLIAACGCQLPASGGRGYEIDSSKIGTGEQAIVPRNDGTFWNGQQMDNRPSHK